MVLIGYYTPKDWHFCHTFPEIAVKTDIGITYKISRHDLAVGRSVPKVLDAKTP